MRVDEWRQRRAAPGRNSLSFHGWAILDLARVEALLSGGMLPPERSPSDHFFQRKGDVASVRRVAALADPAAAARAFR